MSYYVLVRFEGGERREEYIDGEVEAALRVAARIIAANPGIGVVEVTCLLSSEVK